MARAEASSRVGQLAKASSRRQSSQTAMRRAGLAMFILLAGCSSPSPTPAEDPSIITDPLDYASAEAPGSHIHDYWDGQTELTIVDEWSPIGCASSGSQEAPQHEFLPPEGKVVPQGTGVLRITTAWEESQAEQTVPDVLGNRGDYTGFELWIKTAQDSATRYFTNITLGLEVAFNSTNAMNDPPHYTLSLWSFQPYAVNNNGSGSAGFCGRFHMKVIAYRTLDLTVAPPHPDQWLGRTDYELVAEDRDTALHLGLNATNFCLGTCLNTQLVPNAGVVVPHDAARVEAQVSLSTTSTPLELRMLYHGANSRQYREMELQESSPTHYRYVVILEPGQGDSPYATQSLWSFKPALSTPQQLGAWRGDLNITVRVFH